MAFADLTPSTGQPLSVLRLTLTLPLRGAWWGVVEIDATDDETPAAGAPVRLSMAGRSWAGYVVRSRPWQGRARLMVEAGSTGMRTTVAARSYESALLRTVVAQLVTDAGERMAEDASTTTDVLDRWVRAAGVAGVALTQALRSTPYNWRFNDAGEVWWGRESWPAAPVVDGDELEPFGDEGTTTFEPLTPYLSPGQVYAGRQIERVVYTLTQDNPLRAELVHPRGGAGGGTGDLRAVWSRAVRAAVPELPYLAPYPATVIRQGEAGLELQPDSPTAPGTPPVAPLFGLPGVTVAGAEGARVGLVHLEGDPSKPRAAGWEEGTEVDEIQVDATTTIKLGEGAELGVVRRDDLGDGGTITAAANVVTFLDPSGSTIGTLTFAIVGAAITVTAVPPTGIRLVTKAVGCSNKVRAAT